MAQSGLHILGNMFVNIRIFHSDGGGATTFLLPAFFISVSRDCGLRSDLGAGLRLQQRRQRSPERFARLRKRHAVLGTLWTRKARFHGSKIEAEQFRVLSLGRIFIMKQTLLAAIGLNQRDLLFRTAREAQISEAFFIHRKNSARRSIFR